MQRNQVAGIVLCALQIILIPLLASMVCNVNWYTFDVFDESKKDKRGCMFLFGGIQCLLCILASLLVFGAIKF